MTTLLLVPTDVEVDVAAAAERIAALYANLGKRAKAFSPIKDVGCTDALESALAIDNLDDLLEDIYASSRTLDTDVIICQGLAPTASYSTLVNANLADALSAQVILLSNDSTPDITLAIFAQAFGGKDGRVVAAIAPNAAEVTTYFPVAKALDDGLLQIIPSDVKPSLSPSAYRHNLVNKAQAANKRIVLPEGDEPRTVEAASICQSRGIARCVLLAKRENVERVAAERGVTLPEGIEIIDPQTLIEQYVAPMVERRKGKLDEAGAREQLQDTVVLGTMMLYMGDVDGLVSGAIHTTANTIRPAFQLIKTAPQYSLVSSVFFMLLPEQVVAYADCAVNPNPSAEELAEIAIQTADSARAFGIDPKVAMISYSTGASGAGPDVERVAAATAIIRERAPYLAVDGPLQYDAATVESVAKSKAPNSPVAGQANVFIFPDLNTGNTTYKAVQRSAKVLSVGPMLQGLNKPVNDLSRGCLVDDIVYTIALTAIQAAM